MTFQPPPPVLTPASHQPAKTSIWRRRWVKLAGAAALIFLVGLLIGQGSKPRAKTVAGPTVVNTVTATATVTTTPTKVVATQVKTVTVTFTPQPVTAFTDGTFIVGTDIQPGLYKTDDTDGSPCYWERESSLGGGLGGIIGNDNFTGPTTIQVAASDMALKTKGGCDWTKVG